MKNVLFIVAHPSLETSVANKEIVKQMLAQTDQAEVRNLHELYPDFHIDVEAEQRALLDANIVVVQFPFFWYNMPAILKKWFDDVFTHNFAYGSKGDKLKGKHLLASFTVGGPAESYQLTGYNHFHVYDFVKMFEQTAALSQMVYEEPIYEMGMNTVGVAPEQVEQVRLKALRQWERLDARIKEIQNQ